MTENNGPDEFDVRSKEIRQLAGMPIEQLADHLSEVHRDVQEVAPDIAAHLNSVALKTVQYLGSKLPHVGNELPMDGNLQVSRPEKQQWMDLYRTVNDPLTLLDKIKDKTLTGHHIEAVQTIYPDLSNQMREKIHAKLGQMNLNKEELPYPLRLSLSKFLGIPLDSTMTQQNRAAIVQTATQNTSETQAHAGGARNKKPGTGTALSQINKVNSIYPTTLQSRAAQKQKEG